MLFDNLIRNPQTISEEELALAIDSRKSVQVIQFDDPSAYGYSVLAQVNRACEQFGSKVHVRFYGHSGTLFDCRCLRQIPAVRSLGIDSLMRATNLDELGQLPDLERLTFGVFEADVPQLLAIPSLAVLRKLVLTENRTRNIDLAPLVAFRRLEDLTISGHSRHIEVLAGLGSIRRLSLGMGKSVPVGFVGSMTGLRALSIILGGRANLNELEHESLESLAILRVRGMESVGLERFPNLRELHVEDQLRLLAIDLKPSREQLRRLKIWNCKRLSDLRPPRVPVGGSNSNQSGGIAG
jgi:hypothetical protein